MMRFCGHSLLQEDEVMSKQDRERRAQDRGQDEALSWEAKVLERLRKRVEELADSEEEPGAGLGWEAESVEVLKQHVKEGH
jgi:hypothetical protein